MSDSSTINEPNEPLILNNILDFQTVRDKHWYRIPVTSQAKWLSSRWPPRWIAFYQTKVFGTEWKVLRFSTVQVREQLQSYCIPKIASTIDNLGGLDRGNELPRIINLPDDDKPHQPSLFD